MIIMRQRIQPALVQLVTNLANIAAQVSMENASWRAVGLVSPGGCQKKKDTPNVDITPNSKDSRSVIGPSVTEWDRNEDNVRCLEQDNKLGIVYYR